MPRWCEVLVELGLVDRVHRAEAHRHRRELPEVRHQPRVRVGRQRLDLAVHDVALLLAEAVELVLAEPALEVGPGIHAGGGVALEEHLVAAARVVRAAEEVVHPDLVQRRGGRVGRDVAADADARPLGAVDHDRGVPAQPAAVLALDVLVAGEPRLLLGADRVDVVGRRQRRDPDLHLARPLQQLQHDVARPGASGGVDDPVEGLEPLLGLLRVGVGELARDAVEDGSGFLSCHSASSFHTATSLWPSSSAGCAGRSRSSSHRRHSQDDACPATADTATRCSPAYTVKWGGRTKPTRVMPTRSASSTASDEAADTAASTGMPAAWAFWVSSKLARLRDHEDVPGEREPALAQRPAEDLVDGVVPPDVLAGDEQLAADGEQACGVEAAGAVERLLGRAQAARETAQHRGVDLRGVLGHGIPARRLERVDAGGAAHTAGTRGDERATGVVAQRHSRRAG